MNLTPPWRISRGRRRRRDAYFFRRCRFGARPWSLGFFTTLWPHTFSLSAVVSRSHWIQLCEAATPALGYASVVGEDSPAKPAADKV